MTKEVVTIQIGTNANYVGAHFWNLQDEYLATPVHNRDISPAALLSELSPNNRAYASGVRYTPRVQVIDSSGAFGALSTQAGIVRPSRSESQIASAWDGSCQVIERETVHPSQYVRHTLEHGDDEAMSSSCRTDNSRYPPVDDIKYWTDYSNVPLHPRSSFELPGIHHEVSNMQYFVSGEQIAKPLLEDMFRDLRHFVEECDSLGGLNVITNADDAFSGICSAYLEHLLEELGSHLPVLVFGIHSVGRVYADQRPSRSMRRSLPKDAHLFTNEAQLVSSCIDFSTEYIPMVTRRACQLPDVQVDENNLFQASSIFGLALDVALSPIRQRLSISGMLGSIQPLPFATVGNVVCNLPLSTPRLHYGPSLFETEGSKNFSAFPDEKFGASITEKCDILPSSRYYECISARGFDYSLPICSNIPQPVTLPTAFPRVFGSKRRQSGFIAAEFTSEVKVEDCPKKIAAAAGIGTSALVGQDTLHRLAFSLQESDEQRGQTESSLSEMKEALISRAEDYKLLSR